MSAAREQEAARLHEAFDDFKRKMEIETLGCKRELEIQIAVLQRLIEIFKGAGPSDGKTAHAAASPKPNRGGAGHEAFGHKSGRKRTFR